MKTTALGQIRWGEFRDAHSEQRYIEARGTAPRRIARAALCAIAAPAALASVLDWLLLAGPERLVVIVARIVLLTALLGGGLLCGRTRSSLQLATTFSVSAVIALVAYSAIAVRYHLNHGRSDFALILGLSAAAVLAVHPGPPRRASILIPAFLASAWCCAVFMRVPWSASAWNLITIASAAACGITVNFVLGTQSRASYAVNRRLADSESELRRLREAEARSALRALARREDAWQALVTEAPVLILIVDISGCITFVNRAAKHVGFLPGNSLDDVFSLLRDTAEPATSSPFEALLSSADPAQFDAKLCVGNAWRRYNCHVAPVGEKRPHEEVIVLAVDVTLSHELSEALHAAQKQQTLGALAAGVAHDVNNLLSVILGAAELSTMSTTLDGRTRANLDSIQSAVARASRLTRQLLMFASRRASVLGSVDVNVVIADLDVLLRRVLGVDIRIEYDLDPNLGPLQIDQSHLEQVILNLVTNARDAMGASGSLRIETRRTQDGGIISLRDSGCGMSDEVRARIFEPFFTTKGARGTGIGLATVARVIARFGGRLEVQSTLHVGTVVQIRLKAGSKGQTMALAPAEPAASGCMVLLVDDEPEVLRLAAAMLAQRGYETQQARSFDEARACLDAFEPDVVLTDVRLPGLHGRELAATLHALRPNMPVVFMSGCVDDPVLLEAVENGDELLLDKPFTSRELVHIIECARERQLNLEASRLKPTA